MLRIADAVLGGVALLGLLSFSVLSMVESVGYHYLKAGVYATCYTSILGAVSLIWFLLHVWPTESGESFKLTKLLTRSQSYVVASAPFTVLTLAAFVFTTAVLWKFVADGGWSFYGDMTADDTNVTANKWTVTHLLVSILNGSSALACGYAFYNYCLVASHDLKTHSHSSTKAEFLIMH
jgi:hypothetical protein